MNTNVMWSAVTHNVPLVWSPVCPVEACSLPRDRSTSLRHPEPSPCYVGERGNELSLKQKLSREGFEGDEGRFARIPSSPFHPSRDIFSPVCLARRKIFLIPPPGILAGTQMTCGTIQRVWNQKIARPNQTF